eukprot:6203247-Pleurochrysis_carterae.AAC.1
MTEEYIVLLTKPVRSEDSMLVYPDGQCNEPLYVHVFILAGAFFDCSRASCIKHYIKSSIGLTTQHSL